MGDLVDGDGGGKEKGCDGRNERPSGDVPPLTRAMGWTIGGVANAMKGQARDILFLQRVSR